MSFIAYLLLWAIVQIINPKGNFETIICSVLYFSGICLILSFIILVFVLTRMIKRGTDKHIQNKIIIRYALIFLILLPEYFENFALINPDTFKKGGIVSLLFYFAGIWSSLIAVIRFSEPHIQTTMKKSLKRLLSLTCCRNYKANDK